MAPFDRNPKAQVRVLEQVLRQSSEKDRPAVALELAWTLRFQDPKRGLALVEEFQVSFAGSPDQTIRAHVVRAACARRLHDHSTAEHEALAARDLAGRAGRPDLRADATEILADMYLQKGELEAAFSLLDDALEETGLRMETICELQLTRARGLTQKAEFGTALSIIEELLDGIHDRGTRLCEARLHLSRGSILYEMGEARGALDAYRRSLPLLERDGFDYWIALVQYNTAVVLLGMGSLEQAQEKAEESLAHAVTDDEQVIRSLVLTVLAEVHLQRGQLEQAREAAEEARAMGARAGGPQAGAQLRLLGEILLAQRDHDAAQEVLSSALSAFDDRSPGHVGHRLSVQVLLARVHLAAGRAGLAYEELVACEEEARAWGSVKIEGEVQEVLSLAAEAEGNVVTALRHERRRSECVGRLHVKRSDEQLRSLQVQFELAGARQREEAQRLNRKELESLVRERTHQLEEAFRKLRDETGERMLAQTEHDRLVQELRQAQKMEAIGRLAGGVAHDFNNLLTVIQGYAELLLEDLPQDTSLRLAAGEISSAAGRASELTTQLLSFSRKQTHEPVPTDAGVALFELRRMLGRLIGEDIRLEIQVDPSAGVILADPGQLEQVILNLAVNARDAMPDGGVLTLSTFRAVLPSENIPLDLEPGIYLGIAVEDTGVGIPQEISDQIFEPFFTTKDVGRGTGLGLSTAQSIVAQMGGGLHVVSTPGEGSVFEIYLPVAQGEEVRHEEAPTPDAPRLESSGSLLLVEDDPSLRRLVSDGLRNRGYKVLEAGGGDEALQVFRHAGGKLDLIISDLVMPGMGGAKLLETLRKESPDLSFVLVSGFPDRLDAAALTSTPGVWFLPKPFTIGALHRLVSEVCASQRESGS